MIASSSMESTVEFGFLRACPGDKQGLALLPLRDGLLIDPIAPSERSQAPLTFVLLDGLPPSWWRSRVKLAPQRILRIAIKMHRQSLGPNTRPALLMGRPNGRPFCCPIPSQSSVKARGFCTFIRGIRFPLGTNELAAPVPRCYLIRSEPSCSGERASGYRHWAHCSPERNPTKS